ncbi:Heme-binding protein A [Methylorubrum suomiense]|uniref:Heme-binding protein A n=1 Tax=Methylorubrum suomiense TaxID=144191 RepID=A0ABQ4UY82_9HYPH|nr:Heme-binding protein A [Methylorubrum suomiense]
MEPNTKYWNKDRMPSVRIVFDNIISKSDALKAVAAGDGKVDVVTMVTPSEAMAFKSDNAKIVMAKAKTVLVGVFNQNKPDSPWKDIKVRQAMNMAIDRKALIEKGEGGHAELIPAMIQPGRFGYNDSLKPYALDASKAGEVLKAAKIPDATVAIGAGEDQKALFDAMTEQLAKVGLKTKMVDPKGDDFDVKLVWHFDWSPQFPVGVVHREFFGKDGAFRAMPEDPQFDAMFAKLLATPKLEDQEPIVRDIEKYVYDQANVLFLYSPHTLYAVSNRVSFQPYDTFMLELAETKIVKGQ